MPDHETRRKRWEAESRARQEAWMDRIAAQLGRPRQRERPHHPFRGAPDFWQAHALPRDEAIRTFTANFRAVGGQVEEAGTLDDALRFIAAEARRLGARRVMAAGCPEFAPLPDLLPDVDVKFWLAGNAGETEANRDAAGDPVATAAAADIGVVMADHAVALTGSIAVTSAPVQGRSVSLLPPVLFAIVPVSRLATRLGEVLAVWDGLEPGRLPAGIHFISGPSRSADIENDLTIGVHGPGAVWAVLVEQFE